MASEAVNKRPALLAVDGSVHSEKALEFYAENVHRAGSRLIVLYCPELTNIHLRLSTGAPPPYETWLRLQQEEEAAINAVKDKYVKKLGDLKVEAEWKVVRCVSPGESIVEAAVEHDALAVVTGTRGLGTLRRTILGSVSDYVVHHAHCPVIIVRE